MKSKQLRALIYEAIMEVLTEGSKLYTLKNPTDSSKGLPATLDPDDSTEKSPAFTSKYKPVSESEIDEMANVSIRYELSPDTDASDFSGKKNRIITAMQATGEPMSKIEVASELGYNKQNPINSDFMDLVTAGAINQSGGQIAPRFNRPQPAATEVGDEDSETTPAEYEEPEGPLNAEDFFIGNKISQRRGSIFGNTPEPEVTSTKDDELEIPEEPIIPELPISREPAPSGLPDEDYKAWSEYVKYKDRLANIKSALTQTKKLSRGGDDLSLESTEIDRLRVKKAEYEQRMQDILASSKYVQDRLNKEPELNKVILRRFRLLANIK